MQAGIPQLSDSSISRQLRRWTGSDLDLAAICQIDRRIEDHLIAVLDAGAHLDGRSEVAHDGDLVEARDAVLHHRDTKTFPVEDDRLGGNDERRSLRGIFSSTLQ